MKKIMFNDRYGLTEAVLSGRKTMTRRIVPQLVVQKLTEYQLQYFDATLEAISELEAINQIYFVERLAKLPYEIGKVVAIAQAYQDVICDALFDDLKEAYRKYPTTLPGWTNKMFVRADLMPHQIRITNECVERLQDISWDDCLKEGIYADVDPMNPQAEIFTFQNAPQWYFTPKEAYAALIDKVSGKGTWESNPYTFAYDFELVK